MPEELKEIKIAAGGGVVYKNDDSEIWVLLIRRRGFWDIPKGKQDEGEDIANCALREVQEETGAKELQIVTDLGTTIHHYEMDGEMVEKTTWWYAMQNDDVEYTPEAEEQITEIVWLPLNDARQLVSFENLKTVLDRLKGYLGKNL